MGHVIEHLLPGAARSLLALLCDRLPKGAVVSAVVPDMRAIFAAYDRGEVSNDDLNARFVYSYVQPSHHLWCHDLDSLTQLFREAGFRDAEPIDPSEWEPVYWKEGDESRWQCGVRATATGSAHGQAVPDVPAAPATATVGAGGASDAHAAHRRGDAPGAGAAAEGGAQGGVGPGPGPGGGRPPRRAAAPARPAPPGPAAPARPPPAPAPTTAHRCAHATCGRWPSSCCPPGTKRRALASTMLATRRELLGTKARLAELWGRQGQLPTAPQSYRRWARHHDATADELANQVNGWRRTADPLRMAVLVPSTGDDDALARSLKSLEKQSWGDLGGAGHHPARQPRRPAAPVPRPPDPVGRLGRGRPVGRRQPGRGPHRRPRLPDVPGGGRRGRGRLLLPGGQPRPPRPPRRPRVLGRRRAGGGGRGGRVPPRPPVPARVVARHARERQLRRPLLRHPAGPVHPRGRGGPRFGTGPAVGDAPAQPARRDPGLPRHPGAQPPPPARRHRSTSTAWPWSAPTWPSGASRRRRRWSAVRSGCGGPWPSAPGCPS